jgi:aminoacrylate peracid reductase
MTKSFSVLTPAALKWRSSLTFSPAVRVGNLVWTSGLTASDAAGQLVGAGDIVRQTEFIFEKLALVLGEAGGTLGDIVETTEYFLAAAGYERTAEVRRRAFGGPPYPAATGVQVAGLIRPGALIEIKAVAALRQ